MNELQLVLIVFAIIVVGVILLMGLLKKTTQHKKMPSQSQDAAAKEKAKTSLNDLAEGHVPISPSLSAQLTETLEQPEPVPVNQTSLSFGKEFEVSTPPQIISDSDQAHTGSKHHVIYDETMTPVSEETEPTSASVDIKPNSNFGRPKEAEAVIDKPILADTREPKVFVIIVMSSHEFEMIELHQVLLNVGLIYTEKQTYAKLDTFGHEFIHVANVMEPGYFPNVQSDEFKNFKTAGVAVILPLPTTVKAYGAMTEMITIARKVSQKLNGRLYDEQRHLLKESDIQSMRDKAIEYETVAM